MSHADVIAQRAGFAAERLWNFIHVELRFRVVVMIKEWNSEFRIPYGPLPSMKVGVIQASPSTVCRLRCNFITGGGV